MVCISNVDEYGVLGEREKGGFLFFDPRNFIDFILFYFVPSSSSFFFFFSPGKNKGQKRTK